LAAAVALGRRRDGLPGLLLLRPLGARLGRAAGAQLGADIGARGQAARLSHRRLFVDRPWPRTLSQAQRRKHNVASTTPTARAAAAAAVTTGNSRYRAASPAAAQNGHIASPFIVD